MTFKYVEPAIFELVESLASGNAFWLAAPPNQAAPFIIYQGVDGDTFGKNVLNRSAGQAGTVQAYIQVDCYGLTPTVAKELAKAVESTLDGYSGTVYHGTDSPQDSVVIGGISLQNDVDIVDRTDEPLLFRNSAVYLVTYNQ